MLTWSLPVTQLPAEMLAQPFLGAFTKLQRAPINFIIWPSISMEQLSCHWTYLHEILYLGIIHKSQKIQVS
jgi:hypothetical protein